jgi:hypothetical protein
LVTSLETPANLAVHDSHDTGIPSGSVRPADRYPKSERAQSSYSARI